jgi:hypothetical protein
MINEHKKGFKAKKYPMHTKPATMGDRNPVAKNSKMAGKAGEHKNPKSAIAQPRKAKHKKAEMMETVISVIEGWKEDAEAHNEFLAHAREQLQAVSPTERNALAQRLSKLEQKHFPEMFSGGGQVSGDQYDTETGQAVIGPGGISSNIAGIVHSLNRPQKPQGPNIQNLPFGTVSNHDVWNHYANHPDNQGIRPSYAMSPEVDPEEARRREELRQQQNAAAFEPDEMDEFYDSLPQRVKDLKKVAKDPASAARFEELFNNESGMDWHINDIIGYYEYMIKHGPMDPEGYEDARMTAAGLGEGLDDIRARMDARQNPRVQSAPQAEPLGVPSVKEWQAKITSRYPGARFMQAKMPGSPILAMLQNSEVGRYDKDKGIVKLGPPHDSVQESKVNELSTDTMKSYIGKAKKEKDYNQAVYKMRSPSIAADKIHSEYDPKRKSKINKRNAGIGQAHSKIIDKNNKAGIMKEDIMGLGSNEFEPKQHPDPEGQMARQELYRNAKYGMDLLKMIESSDEIEPWVAANLTNAATWLDKVYHYLDYRTKFEPEVDLGKEDKGIKESEVEPSGDIARSNLQVIVEYSMKLFKMIKDDTRLDGWVAMKLTKASEAVSSSKHYLEHVYFDKHSNDLYENKMLRQLAEKLAEGAQVNEPTTKAPYYNDGEASSSKGMISNIVQHSRRTAGVDTGYNSTEKLKKNLKRVVDFDAEKTDKPKKTFGRK